MAKQPTAAGKKNQDREEDLGDARELLNDQDDDQDSQDSQDEQADQDSQDDQDQSSRDAGRSRSSSGRSRPPKFTDAEQAHIDKLVGEARRKARDSERRRILEKSGARDLDELFDLSGEAQERRSRDASQVRDLTTKVTELEQSLQDMQTARDKATHDRQHALRLADIRVRADRMGFADLDDPVRFLKDLETFEITDANQVLGVQEALEKLASERPYLLKSGQGAQTGQEKQAESEQSDQASQAMPAASPPSQESAQPTAQATGQEPATAGTTQESQESSEIQGQPEQPGQPGPTIPPTPAGIDTRVQQTQNHEEGRRRLRNVARASF
jgi:hypothetical protein